MPRKSEDPIYISHILQLSMYHPKLILFALCNAHVQDWQMVLQVSHGVRWCSKTSTHGFVKNSMSVTVSSSNVPVQVRKGCVRHPAAAAPVKLTYQSKPLIPGRSIKPFWNINLKSKVESKLDLWSVWSQCILRHHQQNRTSFTLQLTSGRDNSDMIFWWRWHLLTWMCSV